MYAMNGIQSTDPKLQKKTTVTSASIPEIVTNTAKQMHFIQTAQSLQKHIVRHILQVTHHTDC